MIIIMIITIMTNSNNKRWGNQAWKPVNQCVWKKKILFDNPWTIDSIYEKNLKENGMFCYIQATRKEAHSKV